MKKEYVKPKVDIDIIQDSAILAGSPTVDRGTTSEQNAKEMPFEFFDDERKEWGDIYNRNVK